MWLNESDSRHTTPGHVMISGSPGPGHVKTSSCHESVSLTKYGNRQNY